MNKKIALVVIIFVVLSFIAHSMGAFVVQETEKLKIEPQAEDPDSDKIIITYSYPLNASGEWQTSYGDAGEYESKVSVSDGITSTSEEIMITVERKEAQPVLDSFSPNMDVLGIKEGEEMEFSASAYDPNRDSVSYEWIVDGVSTQKGQSFVYEAGYNDAGSHFIVVKISDGKLDVSKKWEINVENMDVESLVYGISDIIVNENEVVSATLPDFKKLGLDYELSLPLGKENGWKTDYEDAGEYASKLKVEGKGLKLEKNIQIKVNNVDRVAHFEPLQNKIIKENEELKFTLSANDPDNDKVSFAAENLPPGAVLEGNVFRWKPSYETVRRDSIVNRVVGKFTDVAKTFYPKFKAVSNNREIVQNAIITVKDVNRAPAIEDMDKITINEGESFKVSPKVYDPDGDKLKVSYSGLSTEAYFKSGYDNAGQYTIKVTASDGMLETSKDVEVEIMQTNREPVFRQIENIVAKEGDDIAVLLSAYDPDDDDLYFSIDNPPEGSYIKENAFFWKPGFGTTKSPEVKNYDLVFSVDDGKSEIKKITKAQISDANRPPRIINASRSVVARVNNPATMFVKAVDEDGDNLVYEWDFGLLEKYKATPAHQRIFTMPGQKTVKVTVSDGVNSVEQTISVSVI